MIKNISCYNSLRNNTVVTKVDHILNNKLVNKILVLKYCSSFYCSDELRSSIVLSINILFKDVCTSIKLLSQPFTFSISMFFDYYDGCLKNAFNEVCTYL